MSTIRTMTRTVPRHFRPVSVVPKLVAMIFLGGFLGGFLGACLVGCFPTAKKGFDSPDNALRIDASVQAAESGDAKAVPDLVRLLDSDDPATRLVAIRSLEKITGTTLGYDHAGNVSQREAGVQRWQGWLKQHAPGADAKSSPSPRSSDSGTANPGKEAAK